MGISALNGAHDGRATPVFHRAPFLALFNLDDVVEREVLYESVARPICVPLSHDMLHVQSYARAWF